jgi:hypothetical protein
MGYEIATVITFITSYRLLHRKVSLLAQFIHFHPMTIHKWCRSTGEGYQSSFILTSHLTTFQCSHLLKDRSLICFSPFSSHNFYFYLLEMLKYLNLTAEMLPHTINTPKFNIFEHRLYSLHFHTQLNIIFFSGEGGLMWILNRTTSVKYHK